MIKRNLKSMAVLFFVFSVILFVDSCAPKKPHVVKPKVDEAAVKAEQERKTEEAAIKAEQERKTEEAAIKVEQKRKAAEETRLKSEEEAKLKAEEKKKIEEEKLKEAEGEIKPQIAREAETKAAPQLEDIHFDFDKSDIKNDAGETLHKNADWLQKNPAVKIQIEGHCDERGTTEYNLALGDRRAMSTKKYLISLGISADRIHTISYGEELPIDPNRSEDAWAKNRRAHIFI